MMSKIKTIIVLLCSCCLSVANADKLHVKSPDSRVSVEFSLDRNGSPEYSVSFRNSKVILPSRMGFRLADGTSLADGFRLRDVRYNSCDSLWTPVWGENDSIRENYNGMTVALSKGKIAMDIEFRAFDDGVGFRYIFRSPSGKEILISEEATAFAMRLQRVK